MNVHCPEFLWKNIKSCGAITVGLAEPGLVSMRWVTSDWLGRDGAIVSRVSWVSQAVITPYRTPLGPPETRLACSSPLPGSPQVTRTIVSTGTGG